MSKTWLVCIHHLKKNVLKKSFIFVLLSIPLFIAFTVSMAAMGTALENSDAPLGYVDESGLLADPIPLPIVEGQERVQLIAFDSQPEARAALDSEQIGAYFVLTEEYLTTRQAELYYYEEPGDNAWSDFYDFLQLNLAANLQPDIQDLVVSGSSIMVRLPDGSREQPDGAPTFASVLPIIVSAAFIGLILFSAVYMLEGISDEKLNRTIEVIFTSVSPSQLISGKILGIIGINFLQLLTWILVAVIAVFLAGNVLNMEWFKNPSLDWAAVLPIVAIGIPTYVIAAAIMLAVGSTVVEAQEGQAVGGLFYMVMLSPLFLIVLLIENPDGPAAIVMTLLPFTSLLTVSLRNLFYQIPSWQIAASILIQISLALVSTWVAVRAFRLGMLRYGKRLRLSEIFNRRQQPRAGGGTA